MIENDQARSTSRIELVWYICLLAMQFIQIISHVPFTCGMVSRGFVLLNRTKQKSASRGDGDDTPAASERDRKIIEEYLPTLLLIFISVMRNQTIHRMRWNRCTIKAHTHTPLNWLSDFFFIYSRWARQWNRKHCHLFEEWKKKKKKLMKQRSKKKNRLECKEKRNPCIT